MVLVKSILVIVFNLILYFLFGSLVLFKKDKKINAGLSIFTGFFTYYILFFLVCFPYMIKYRPFTWFVNTIVPIIVAVIIVSLILNFKKIGELFADIKAFVLANKLAVVLILFIVALQAVLVCTTYNFTLDAAYYVSNVTTTIDTNMINVYDPFTGAWQDHYEVRYLFATYSINDALICYITGIPALLQTKFVMSATVIILVNILYVMIAYYLLSDMKKTVIMTAFMFFVNVTFNTIFTSSLFLLTRTYEGKTVIGNLSVLFIFYIFMKMMNDDEIYLPWLMLFIVSLGSMTISSSGNMLIPAELSVLFVPYMLVKKTLKPAIKYILCMVPGIAIVLIYILYVKGVFVFHTYPVF